MALRSLARGQPHLCALGPLNDATTADRYRRGMRPYDTCSWCGATMRLALVATRCTFCPHCDRA